MRLFLCLLLQCSSFCRLSSPFFSPGCLKNGHSNVVGFNFRNGCVVLNQYNE
ncbi:hypothetical protein CKO_02866 [Citrobacter koseri ATCC BAA-895]|uniref:Uncharacterized protein n=1 Tax=Citrobacter koseri (strain ATCC BAA-895 / CDC 4225-83 / SGSC4696) TaxID=290338 RepID=A8AKF9_CITK8|nr:hypothetical protein CKO_02866 [Citrobacter koseri ATCC BAA-895]